MSILLPKKLLFSFFFSVLFLHFISTITLAQPDFFSYLCETSHNFTANSAYERNLNDNFNALPTTNSGFGFFNLSTGEGNDRVNSLALCRGDITPDACSTCLNDSITKLRQMCPNKKEGIGYYDNCLLRYSNAKILESTGINFYVFFANTSNASDIDHQFNSAFEHLMNRLIYKAAAGGPLRKFGTGNITGPDLTRIYALVQCTPDLSELQCGKCLQNAVNHWRLYNGRVGGRLYVAMCNFRYETYRFFNDRSTLAIPSPSSLSSITTADFAVISDLVKNNKCCTNKKC